MIETTYLHEKFLKELGITESDIPSEVSNGIYGELGEIVDTFNDEYETLLSEYKKEFT